MAAVLLVRQGGPHRHMHALGQPVARAALPLRAGALFLSRWRRRNFRRTAAVLSLAMLPIILEGVLFVALLATAGALVLWGVWHVTPLGRVTRQLQNRRRLLRAADLTCPIHGAQDANAMVRLSDGTRVCPVCFQETVNGQLD